MLNVSSKKLIVSDNIRMNENEKFSKIFSSFFLDF
jgi:hypothetical protein